MTCCVWSAVAVRCGAWCVLAWLLAGDGRVCTLLELAGCWLMGLWLSVLDGLGVVGIGSVACGWGRMPVGIKVAKVVVSDV